MGASSGIVLGVTLFLYILAFGLALGAVTRRSKGELKAIDPVTGVLQCQYTSDIATGLAAGAIIFLILAQLFIMIVTRCLCCGSGYKPGAARTFGVLMFIISWLCFIIAAATLLAGAAQNKIHTKGYGYVAGPTITCRQVRESLFGAGAAFTFLTMLFTEAYYILISKARDSNDWQSSVPSVGMASYT